LYVLEREQLLSVQPDEAFEFFADAFNLERITPPWLGFRVATAGPYRHWHHTHSFEPRDGGTLMRDIVRYSLPVGPLGRLARVLLVRRDLERIFDFRRDSVDEILRPAHALGR
jgi:ligand-binding SRPBCC domain-containing protein